MSVVRRTIEAMYTTICRDEVTATGGIDPQDTSYPHAEGFMRLRDRTMEEVNDSLSIDRKVQILYRGVPEVLAIGNNYNRKIRYRFTAHIRIGWYGGDDHGETSIIIGEDIQDIFIALRAMNGSANPTGTTGCIEGVHPHTADVVQVSNDRFIAEIPVTVQVKGIKAETT